MSSKTYYPKGTNDTPFNPQLQHFDFICGQIIQENRILKFVVIAAVLSFFLSVGICIYAVSQPDSIPVLVTMNDFGETEYIGPVSRKNYQNYNVPEVAVSAQVKEFINLTNTLSTDKAVMKKAVNKTYHLLTSTTASKYTTLVKENNPFKDFGNRTKEVLFQTEPLKVSNDTYQMDYQVITRQLSGQITDNETFRAVISVKMLQPAEEDIKDNPLGIYITAFDMKPIETRTLNQK
ncbi:MAG: type IV secretion system protein [Treponema sp.]|nr:type IV secretion system protein [Treponema sp.]